MQYTILCVDDVQTNLFTLESILAAEFACNMVKASSGEEALTLLLKKKVDLILMDVQMPQMSGFETTKLIKANKKTKNIPVIFLTARSDLKSIEEGFAVGGIDYVTKPYNIKELIARIQTQLSLKESKEQLLLEKACVQTLLDTKTNISFVLKQNQLLYVNQAFLNFFAVESSTMFLEQFGSLFKAFGCEDLESLLQTTKLRLKRPQESEEKNFCLEKRCFYGKDTYLFELKENI